MYKSPIITKEFRMLIWGSFIMENPDVGYVNNKSGYSNMITDINILSILVNT